MWLHSNFDRSAKCAAKMIESEGKRLPVWRLVSSIYPGYGWPCLLKIPRHALATHTYSFIGISIKYLTCTHSERVCVHSREHIGEVG